MMRWTAFLAVFAALLTGVVSTPAAFDAFIRVEMAKWAKVVKDSRLTLE